MFNLNTAKLQDTAVLQLRDVHGDVIYYEKPVKDGEGNISNPGKAVEFELYRMRSDHMRKWLRSNSRDQLKGVDVTKDSSIAKAIAPLAEDDIWQISLLATATKDWRGLEMNGPFVCSYENATTLYKDRSLNWISDQVLTFIQEDANYLGNS